MCAIVAGQAGLGCDHGGGAAEAAVVVWFEPTSQRMAEGSTQQLSRFASLCHRHPLLRVRIDGHVGMRAPSEICLQFSMGRAHEVANR